MPAQYMQHLSRINFKNLGGSVSRTDNESGYKNEIDFDTKKIKQLKNKLKILAKKNMLWWGRGGLSQKRHFHCRLQYTGDQKHIANIGRYVTILPCSVFSRFLLL